MRALDRLGRDEARRITGVFFDLDDTLLTRGVLTRAAYGALWDLHDAGIRLVAVTGRPSGWAEVLVRQWPIDGAVTENGAVFVVRDGHGVRVILDDAHEEKRTKLDALVADVRLKMPNIGLADDVHARRSDVTWDIGERALVPEEEIAKLARIVVDAGARTTRSTVHLHASFERDDKASGALRFVRDQLGEDPGSAIWRWAFIGDSPNDAACFSAFHTTFGVANVRDFVLGKKPTSISVPPRWIASLERGEGFNEIARALLAARA
jgi:HAD superfamily hydrolase (TIGR01484 family)